MPGGSADERRALAFDCVALVQVQVDEALPFLQKFLLLFGRENLILSE